MKTLKSFRELAVLKKQASSTIGDAAGFRKAQKGVNRESTKLSQGDDLSHSLLERPKAGKYRHLTAQQRSRWAAVFKLLGDQRFFDLAADPYRGEIKSAHYAVVTAVLTHPTKTDGILDQRDLDAAHYIARVIRHAVKSGRIKYSPSRLPGPRIVSGSYGTGR